MLNVQSGKIGSPKRSLLQLEHLNPAMKGLTVILCVLPLSLAFDPVTVAAALALTVLVTWLFGNIPWKRWLLLFSPFLILAFGYFWTAALFPREPIGPDSELLWSVGAVRVTQEACWIALSLSLRALLFSALSLLFMLTTDPVKLMLSLMQQCKLPPRLAYGILAGFRFLPLFREELSIMQKAHRVRGAGRIRRTPRSQLQALKRYGIPLLAGAIRKSERTAVAMISRGFTGSGRRDFYTRVPVTWKDGVFMALMLAIVAIGYGLSYALGTLRWYNGEL
ncbi:energy-coupling factor transporter transmembrane component T [Paenibacillus sp. VCA1]|uniref:energy-coupling factor transporter transmembrane component T family protein n=1 Tax=Paenibacillus sp. VCA1 TaxID=3039148 RepID=UPI002870E859|nr:energy-coupling factor transporter transmembrane component T [Paenibacillus sp. VCA1]MDR9853260.1 energy-coupling factor transporter transmembrane component T [Paenibacillus sp. VCA1]